MLAVSVRNFTRRSSPGNSRVFSSIADAVLPGWEISLVFVGPTRAKKLNIDLRGKSYIPNVLSYVVGKQSGEIIICPNTAATQARDFGLSVSNFILLLFIHGVLHLEGGVHGVTMERREQRLLAKYARSARVIPNVTTHRNRN